MKLTRIVRAAARRPKTTIALWLLLVVGCVVGRRRWRARRTLDAADAGVGESARADKQPRPPPGWASPRSSRSSSARATPPRPPRPPPSSRGRLDRAPRGGERRTGPPTRRDLSTSGGRTVLVRRTLRGDPDDAADHVAPIVARGRGRRAAEHPASRSHEAGDRHGRQGVRRRRRQRPPAAPSVVSLPITLVILAARLRRARRRLRAAAARHHVGRRRDGRARRRLAARPDGPTDRLAGRADRARRRRRLLALLHPPRARGARAPAAARTPRSTRPPRPSAARSSSPASP